MIIFHANKMKQHIIFRGSNEKQLQTAITDVKEMTHAELLKDKDKDVLQKEISTVSICLHVTP